jgi:hypothetical protein
MEDEIMNGNPFYVPPVVPDMSENIMEFGKMAMQKDNLAQQRMLEERRLTGQESFQNESLAQGRQKIGIEQQTADLQKEKYFTEHPQERPYSEGEYTKMLTKFQTSIGDTVKKISFLNGPLKEMAKNPNYKRGEIAREIEQNWPEIHSQTSDEIRNEILSLSKKAQDISPMDPNYKKIAVQIEKLGAFQSKLDNIKSPTQTFFADIYQNEQNTKAAIEALKNQYRGDIEKVVPPGGILTKNGEVIVRNPTRSSTAGPGRLVQVDDGNGNITWAFSTDAVGKKAPKKAGKKNLADLLNPGGDVNDPLNIRKK